LLDELCESQDLGVLSQNEDQATLARLAWMGFKVLAQRCIAWEEEEQTQSLSSFAQKCEPLSLENQISNLLANYLVKATKSGNFAVGNEVLQEVLVLLSALSKSRLGRGILSQPPCVSKLLLLLMEPYLSPKVTMTIVKLANVALPIMTREACLQLSVHPLTDDTNVESKIVNLLLTKLSDYLIPESETFHKSDSPEIASPDEIEDLSNCIESQAAPQMESTTKLSLYVHKRKDQVSDVQW
jgi:E3 ubiquitin-protein ligase HECTD4